MLNRAILSRPLERFVYCLKNLPALFLIIAIIALSLAGSLTTAMAGQKKAAQPQQQESQREKLIDAADISISGSVKARELRFEIVPDAKVEFSGSLKRDTQSKSERVNLPDTVEPGVTYRNFEINFHITTIFPGIEKILSDLFGLSFTTEEKAAPVKKADDLEQAVKRANKDSKQ